MAVSYSHSLVLSADLGSELGFPQQLYRSRFGTVKPILTQQPDRDHKASLQRMFPAVSAQTRPPPCIRCRVQDVIDSGPSGSHVSVGVEMCVMYADVSWKALPIIALIVDSYWYRGRASKQIKPKTQHRGEIIHPLLSCTGLNNNQLKVECLCFPKRYTDISEMDI